ncbi:MAG: DegQ family serine endoprotease [Desulfobacteraceae bacterium]|nr:DegQ family serine endoprotease [Desulfobacteraceae bacterium]
MKSNKIFKVFSTNKMAMIFVFLVAGFLAISGTYSIPDALATSGDVKGVPDSFTELAEKFSPAVVNIRAEKSHRVTGHSNRQFQNQPPSGKGNPYHDFFEKFFGDQAPKEFRQRGLGSGFIIDENGHIVTNNHVVQGADKIKVILKDKREFDAKIVGLDPNTDLALIKITSDNHLPIIEFGNSDTLKVGEWVVAIGNPFGLEHTVTAGIISAKGRVIGSGPYDDFLQTDASINPGNSGGPLIDMQGKVIGINTAIIPRGQGIGFAIPVNLAKGIVEQLKTKGEVTRGWLGVGIQDLTKELREYHGIADGEGVLVTQAFPGNPAEKAGIKTKDIILEVNGRKVKNSRDLSRMIAESPVGATVNLLVLQDGKEKVIGVKLGKRDDKKLASSRSGVEKKFEFGIHVADLTPEMAKRLNTSEKEGVVVMNVEPDSKGQKAGILPGDLIKEVNHKVIDSVDSFEKEIHKVKTGDSLSLYIWRMSRGFIVIKLTK